MKLFLLFLLVGCAQVTSLNMRQHEFGIVPARIIWFQVAGLDTEHVASLRFRQSGNQLTSFEQSVCIGKSWGYNLYNIRTTAEASFLAQITGKKNIKSSCEDTELKPVWNYLSTRGYTSGVLEIGPSPVQSLSSILKCGEGGKNYLSALQFWIQAPPPAGEKSFYYGEDVLLKPGQISYDRSCKGSSCTSSITDNVKGIHTQFERQGNKSLFIVRDFSYLAAIEKKDFIRARDILLDLERAYAQALRLSAESNDYLVMLSTGDSRIIDFPDQGKAWFEFEKSGANIQMKRTSLSNVVLASGARAENFCGVYEDSDVFERLLSGPKQQGLELKLINPFR